MWQGKFSHMGVNISMVVGYSTVWLGIFPSLVGKYSTLDLGNCSSCDWEILNSFPFLRSCNIQLV
jgi:hypothetical protein